MLLICATRTKTAFRRKRLKITINSIVVDEKSNRLEVNVPTRCSPCATHKDSIFCLFNKMIAVAKRLPILCCMLYSTHSASSQFIMTKILFKDAVCTFIELQAAIWLTYKFCNFQVDISVLKHVMVSVTPLETKYIGKLLVLKMSL